MRRFLHTLRYLQYRQIGYRLWYPIKRKIVGRHILSKAFTHQITYPKLAWPSFAPRDIFEPQALRFTLLNVTHVFEEAIDWTMMEHGLLWNFHLHYFNWLQDDKIPVEDKERTMYAFAHHATHSSLLLRPYPASLRLRNWIQFVTKHGFENAEWHRIIYRDALVVYHFTEYHLLANHLLENALSLYWAGLFLGDERFLGRGEKLLRKELAEQILPDGAHYELSPMYHIHLTHQVLQSLVMAKAYGDEAGYALLYKHAGNMMGWITAFAYPDGSYAQVGDSTHRHTLTVWELQAYARALGVDIPTTQLRESGYRKVSAAGMEVLIKGNPPYPPYQPGHRHADDLSLTLWYNGNEIICDRGVTTYQELQPRIDERSTSSHNTVTLDNYNNQEVWHAFRMGKRNAAKLEKIAGGWEGIFTCTHPIRYIHHRKLCTKGDKIYFCDLLKTPRPGEVALRLHFSPHLKISRPESHVFVIDNLTLQLEGFQTIEVHKYQYSTGFNQTQEATYIKAIFSDNEATTYIYTGTC